MSAPTPRTDAAVTLTFAAGHKTVCPNFARTLERELAVERARLDWLMAGGVCLVQHSGGFYVSRLHAQVSRAAIDSAMKEEGK